VGAEKAGTTGTTIKIAQRNSLGVLQIHLLIAGAASPAGLTTGDPRGEVAVKVGFEVVLLLIEAVEIELHLRRRADSLP
jgi:hypothetical protein